MEVSLKRLLGIVHVGRRRARRLVRAAERRARIGEAVGAIAWYGLWLGVLALIALTLTLAARAARGRAAHGAVR